MKKPQHKTNIITYQKMHRKYIAQHSQDNISSVLYVPVWASFATKISYIQHINDTKVLLKKKKKRKPTNLYSVAKTSDSCVLLASIQKELMR